MSCDLGSANDSEGQSDSECPNESKSKAAWFVYIVQCANGSFYTGITTDLERRFSEHQAGAPKGAKALRGKGPLKLVFSFSVTDRSEASQIEYRVKQLSRTEKLLIVRDGVNRLKRILDLETV